MKETHKIELLKCSRIKNGYTFHNLYIRIDEGDPIAVKLAFENRKLKNFVLACSQEADIRQAVAVRYIEAEDKPNE